MKRLLIIFCGLFLSAACNRALAQHAATIPHTQKKIKPIPGALINHMPGIHIQSFTQSCPADTILLTSQAQIDNFNTTYPTCTMPNYLIIDGTGASPAITSLAGLSSITTVVEKLQISNTSVTNLSQMSGLVQVDTLDIRHNALMTGIGLNNLTYLGDIFFVDLPLLSTTAGLSNHIDSIGSVSIDSTALTNLNGLSNITKVVSNGFGIAHSPITDFDGLNLQHISAYFYLDSDTLLTHIGLTNLHSAFGFLFSNLPRLNSIAGLTAHLDNDNIGTFWMIQTGLSDLTGLSSLTGASNFYIWINPNLTTLNGLQNITGNVDGISFWSNDNLDSLTQLSNITSIDNGTFEVNYSQGLTSLRGIQNITHMGDGLWLTSNYNLDSLSLNSNLIIENNYGDNVLIHDNSVLAVCASQPICNYLNANGVSEIHDNATGCSSTSEILALCTSIIDSVCAGPQGDDKYWGGSVSSDWNDADNWSPAGVPDLCNKVIIPDQNNTNNSPVASGDIHIGGLEMDNGALLDMQNHNLIVNKTLDLEIAEIENGGQIKAIQVYAPTVSSSRIHGDFSCLDYGGNSNFIFNEFYGNTVISDSTGRTESSSTFLNHYHGDLTCVQNADYGNFYLANASPGYDYIEGNLTLVNNSSGGMSVGLGGDRPIKVDGNITATATGSGTIDFNTLTISGIAFSNKHITYTGSQPMTVNNFYNERYNGTVIDQDMHVNNQLGFEGGSGELYTTASGVIIMENNSNAYSYGGFVSGPMRKIGNQQFTFPIGKIENNTVWGPAGLTISAPASSTDQYTAEYFRHNPSQDGYDTSHYAPGSGVIRGNEYWNLTRDQGTSNVTVTLPYDTTRSGYNPYYQSMQIAGWNGSSWQSWGTGGYNGDFYRGTVISGSPVTQFGPLAFSYQPVRKPVISMGPVDTIHCQYNYFYVPFTLDTLAIINNSYHVEVSDTFGNFSTFFNPQIGSKFTNHSDSIYCFTPNFGFYGLPYKIRIVGNSAPDTSVNTRTVIFMSTPQGNFNIIAPSTPPCTGTTVKYYPDVHLPNATGYNWSWGIFTGGTINTVGDTAYVTWTGGPAYYTIACAAYNQCGTGTSRFVTPYLNPPAPVAVPTINNTGRWLYASPAPSGTGYQWFNNGLLISGATNSSYYAALSGNYTAEYITTCAGGPASNTISFATNSLAQTISFPQPADRTYGDPPFAPLATASSGFPVAFTIISGPATVNTQTNTVTVTGIGTVTIRASQAGDNTYDTAAPVTRTFNVNKAAQTISFTTIADQDISNNTVQLTATSSSGLPVSFSVVSGPATVSANLLTLTGVGTITIKASQPGDNNYLAATDVNKSFCSYITHLSSISGYTNLCPGTATYSVNNVTGAIYSWRIAGGSTLSSTTNTADATWPAPGDYILIVSATGNCGAASANDTLAVHVISSILPDSVHGMLPANGAINQQLPLILSWIPAQPANFYTFDVYIWKASDLQPATPTVSGITTLNYTIPLSSGLLSNTAYKWMVVAHNGSCIQINTGPVQQFTLIPLPDLVVSNVQAPVSAFSGQTISINWTVTNPGPGFTTTNQSWTDAVFLSFDSIPNFHISPQTDGVSWSQLDFPVRPLLIGTKPNVSALDPGQSYNNSISYTLPLSYSQPLYAYVITNYPASGNAPQQVTVSNDTAHAPQPIAVTLSPTPDLRVDTVFVPSSTFSGSMVTVTYKVKNYGVQTPAGSVWTDKFYISQNPIFSLQNAIPLKAPKANGTYYANAVDRAIQNSTQLLGDSSYTRTADVVIPNYIFGNYFIWAFTNQTQSVYEGALAGNNVTAGGMQVFLTPTPHLTVSTVSLPVSTVSTTQPVGLTWNILNTGFNDNIEKNKGNYYVTSGSCLIPPPPCNCQTPNCVCILPPPQPGITFRDSLGFGGSYWPDHIYMNRDSSALNTTTAIDLGVATHGILNAGLNVPDDYSNPAASGCHPLGSQTSGYNADTYNVIAPNENYAGALNFNIPDTLSPGNYYVWVYANSTRAVYEYPGLPETRRAPVTIQVQRPDIYPTGVSVPATTTGGTAFTVTYSVANNGPGKVYNHLRKDRIYVSSSPVFDGSAQVIGSPVYTEDITPGTPVTHTFSFTFLPATSGTRYIYVDVNYDSSFSETTMSNNISAAVSTVVSPGNPADLVVPSFLLADTVYTASNTYFKYTVQNNGPGTTQGLWTDSLFISCSPLFSNNTNIYIGKRTHQESLSTGVSYTDSFYLAMPMSFDLSSCFPRPDTNTAYLFVKTNADNGVYEGSNTNNNVTVSGSRVLINLLVDHIVTTVTPSADVLTAGHPFNVNWTVKNIGYNPAGLSGSHYYSGWYDDAYFSTDSVFNNNAQSFFFQFQNTILNHNQSYNGSQVATVPNLPTGDYYLFAYTNAFNQIAGEKNLLNNWNAYRNTSGAAKPVHIIQPVLPDLKDSIIYAPASVAVGQPVTIVHRVTNIGAGITYPSTWSEDQILSTDFIPYNGNDITLAGETHNGALSPGQYYDDTVVVTININTTPGNYVLISRTNPNINIYETGYGNNNSFAFINVYSPPPVDLVVQNISRPDTAYLGYELDSVKWIVRNISANTATGISSDGVYLSHSNVLDSTAFLIGIKNKNINIAPLSQDMIALEPTISNVTEGYYNLFVKTDILNNITESDKTNNVGISAAPIYVSVKELHMNALLPDVLGTQNRIYKLIVPDTLAGSTIRVRLKSNDSTLVTNQMFLGLGYVPDAGHYDYAYPTPNYGNQDIVITSVVAGTYYITVRCVTTNPPQQNITLYAEKLPFLVTNVESSSGGNIGNVTVKISGSLFVNNMSAVLSKSGTTITASSVYYTNSTIVYATFNLQGKPLGIYDVTLTKPDSTTATLPQSFSIVAANNGGANTGGGVNTGSGDGNAPGCDPGAAGGINSQLVTQIVEPATVFGGWVFVIQINYNNPTNFDIPAQVRTLYSEDGCPVALTSAGVSSGTNSLTLQLTEQNGPPGIIRAGGSGTITVYTMAPTNFPAHHFVHFVLQ